MADKSTDAIYGQICIVLLFINYIRSLLFFPTDQQVQDLKGTSFRKSLKENQEKDVPPLAVNKRFLEVDSVAFDHCEDETSKPHKVDKDFKATVNQADLSG